MIEPLKLPGVYEVLFCNETEDSPGMMLWRYPEPRVLTLVRITPVPFNTTEDPDISTADLGDVLQVGNGSEFVTKLIMASAGPILGKNIGNIFIFCGSSLILKWLLYCII